MPTATVTSVTDESFVAEVLESEQPVVVDFWAAWCGPCRVMSPVLEEIAAERPDLRVVKVDVDSNQGVAARYGVLSMPTFMIFRAGEPVLTLVGTRPKRRLLDELAAVL
jgi:thioredoxin 1